MAVKNKVKVIDLTQGVNNKMVMEANTLKLEQTSFTERDAVGLLSATNYNGYSFAYSNSSQSNYAYRLFDNSTYTKTIGHYFATQAAGYPGAFTIVPPKAKILTKMGIWNGYGTGLTGISKFSIFGTRADNGESVKLGGPFIIGWTTSGLEQYNVVRIPEENQIACTRWEITNIENDHATSLTCVATELSLYEKVPSYADSGSYTSATLDLGEQGKQITSVSISGSYTSNITTTVAYSNDGVTFGAFGAPAAGKGRYAIVKASMTRYSEIETPTLTGMTLNYQVEDRYLIKEGSDYKSYTGSAWNNLGTTLDRALLIAQGMTDLSVIPKSAWQSLNAPEIICLSEEVNATRATRVTGVKKPFLIKTSSDIDVKILKRLSMVFTQTNSGILRVILSTDSGITWQGKKSVNPENNVDIETNGFSPVEFNALTDAEWKTLASTGKLRFGFYMNRIATADSAAFNSISREDYSYETAPAMTTGFVNYKTTTATIPTFYASRDDGVTWKRINLDELTSIKEIGVGKNVRIKVELLNGQLIQGLAFSWV